MASVAGAGRLRAFSALRHRDFRWFFLNIGVQSFGQGIQFLGIGFLILDLTGDKTSFGLAVSLFGVSNLFFTFVGGVLADRVERRLYLIACVFGNGSVTVALGILAVFDLAVMWHVYVAVFLMGGISAMQMPARFALAADLVPREDMMTAVALHTSTSQVGNMIGPLIGGWAIRLAGTGSAIILNGATVLLGIVFLLMMSRRPVTQRSGASPVADLIGGFSHAIRTPMAAILIIMAAAFGFFGMAYMQVIAGFAQEFLKLNEVQTGILMTFRGGGAFLGSMVVASWGNRRDKGLLMYLELTACCVALIALGWIPWFWGACFMVALVGSTSIGGFWPVSSSIMQLTTEPQMRGRMMALMQFAPVFHFLGAWPLTWLAQLYGWSVAISSGAVVLLVISLGGWLYRPMVRRMNEV
jgi:predicted MFS family arabinose efflux permease